MMKILENMMEEYEEDGKLEADPLENLEIFGEYVFSKTRKFKSMLEYMNTPILAEDMTTGK